ncbi:nucleotidyltransferase domain-containing protein [Alicyclobacillus fastidiosus]|uniref:nucleotidyltransferase domain-containing protein n=1 Tax=Alicyclobacillus fastidiosus TaxID=392011 RepID=UPI0034D5FCA7
MGGWSIDLTLEMVTRQHEDVDICVFREYVQGVLDYFCRLGHISCDPSRTSA